MSTNASVFDRFTEQVKVTLAAAQQEVERLGYATIEPEHLLFVLLSLRDSMILHILQGLGIDSEHLRGVVVAAFQVGKRRKSGVTLSLRAKMVIEFAVVEMRHMERDYIGTEHLLLGLLQKEESYVSDLLRRQGITLEVVRAEIVRIYAQGVTEKSQFVGVASVPSASSELPEEDQSDISQVGVMPSAGFVSFDSVHQRLQQSVQLARSQQHVRQLQRVLICIVFGLLAFFIVRLFSEPDSSPDSTWLSNLRSFVSLVNNAPVLNWQPIVGWSPLLVLTCFVLASAFFMSIKLPFDAYVTFFAPRRYGLITGRTRDWLVLRGKILLFALFQVWLFIEVATLLITIQPQTWWVWVTLIQFLYSLLMTRFASTWLFARLTTIEPLSDTELEQRLRTLLTRLHLPVCGIFVAKLSYQGSVVSAYSLGWGHRRRIVLTEALLQNFSYDEIEVFLALELAHLVHHTIWKRLVLDMLPFLCLYCVVYLGLDMFLDSGTPYTHLLMIAAVFIVMLIINGITGLYYHRQLYQADEFALQVMGKILPFRDALIRLSDKKLLVATFLLSAPRSTSPLTLTNRLQHIDKFAARSAASKLSL